MNDPRKEPVWAGKSLLYSKQNPPMQCQQASKAAICPYTGMEAGQGVGEKPAHEMPSLMERKTGNVREETREGQLQDGGT